MPVATTRSVVAPRINVECTIASRLTASGSHSVPNPSCSISSATSRACVHGSGSSACVQRPMRPRSIRARYRRPSVPASHRGIRMLGTRVGVVCCGGGVGSRRRRLRRGRRRQLVRVRRSRSSSSRPTRSARTSTRRSKKVSMTFPRTRHKRTSREFSLNTLVPLFHDQIDKLRDARCARGRLRSGRADVGRPRLRHRPARAEAEGRPGGRVLREVTTRSGT